MACRLSLSVLLLAWLITAVNAQDLADNSTTNVLVGWQTGPDTRSTLGLIWSCLGTIFACTWTVLHLNLPGLDDTTWEKTLRKVKWLAINILFPEFIFSKAVCDLRLALEELREFDENLRENGPFTWIIVDRDNNGQKWLWAVEYPRGYRLLYRLLGLKTPPAPSDSETQQDVGRGALSPTPSSLDSQNPSPARLTIAVGSDPTTRPMAEKSTSSQEQASNQKQPAIKPPRIRSETEQKWTAVHSYYAQMGGLLKLHYILHGPAYSVFTACMLTPQYKWNKNSDHPLVHLVLSKDDIQDKSKADWLLKGIAVLQITWLIVSVAARHTTKLPITQLEIATVAFAIMAVAIYLASWWKPKDVSRPTVLQGGYDGYFAEGVIHRTQRLTLRLLSPTRAADESKSREESYCERVQNDVVWMGGNNPPMFVLMAISSMVFGGLHCLAWNFDFPTRVELICWRVASLTSAILPVITLFFNGLLGYIADSLLESRFLRTCPAKLESLRKLPQAWWSKVTYPTFMGWSSEEITTLISQSTGDRNWKVPPSAEIIANARASERWRDWDHIHVESKRSHRIFKLFGVWWHMFMIDDSLRGHMSYAPSDLNRTVSEISRSSPTTQLVPHEVLKFWHNYEEFIFRELDIPTTDRPNHSFLELSLHDFKQFQEAVRAYRASHDMCNRISTFLTIFSGILYTSARLAIIVLLFTCLRSTPVGVYQNVSWTQFLPNIS